MIYWSITYSHCNANKQHTSKIGESFADAISPRNPGEIKFAPGLFLDFLKSFWIRCNDEGIISSQIQPITDNWLVFYSLVLLRVYFSHYLLTWPSHIHNPGLSLTGLIPGSKPKPPTIEELQEHLKRKEKLMKKRADEQKEEIEESVRELQEARMQVFISYLFPLD